MGTNMVIIVGHLGADPVLKTTNTNNVPVCNIRVATNRRWTNAQQQLVEDTQWHNIVCWNKVANTVAQFMHKGSHVLVEGRLQTREFMGPATYENGSPVVDGAGNPILVKRYTTEIVATSVQFLDKKPTAAAYAPVVGAPAYVAPIPGTPVYVAPVAGAPVPGVPVVMNGQPVVAGGNPNAVAATFVQSTVAGVDQPVVGPGV